MTPERKKELTTKALFVEALQKNIFKVVHKHSLEAIEYEVYEHKEKGWITEYLKVTFIGGAISVRNCTGNSCLAIMKELSKIVSGGYYDEVEDYQKLVANSDTVLVDLKAE